VANNDTRSFLRRFPRISLARARARSRAFYVLHAREKEREREEKERNLGLRLHSCSSFPLVDIDGGHNAETNRVPRRIYMHASGGVSVCAYRLVSIYSRPGVFGPPAEEGSTPIVRLTNIVLLRPAFGNGFSSSLPPSLSRLPLSLFTYSPVFLSFSLAERAVRPGMPGRRSGRSRRGREGGNGDTGNFGTG